MVSPIWTRRRNNENRQSVKKLKLKDLKPSNKQYHLLKR